MLRIGLRNHSTSEEETKMTVDQDHDHHDHGELKTRLVTVVEAAYKTLVAVEHVYDNDVCSACGTLSTGFVGIRIRNEDEDERGDEHGDEHDGEKCASALLDAGEALLLADRITRAAHLVLETTEEPADFEREVIRHTEGREEVSRHD
jgi:hypothetical protein